MSVSTRRPGAGFVVSSSVIASLVIVLFSCRPACAADQWIEVKSAHFTITSNAGKGATSTLAWQLEQMRSEIAVLWPWAVVDLNRPLVVFALKDQQSMKNLAPVYWEKKNGAGSNGIASVWVSGFDRTFIALRTDVEQDAKRHVNPYASSYFAYFSLVLQQSVPRRLPPWFARGLAGVMSNTVIDDKSVLLGPPAPWYLDTLHSERRIPLAALVAARDGSPLLKGDDLPVFDAEAWALVHFLMFADNAARWERLGKYSALVAGGTDADAAFRETIGRTADLEGPLAAYVNRSIYSYRAVQANAAVARETFAVAPLSAAEAAARRALFHVAMRRPVEARAALDESRKAGAAPDADLGEALLLDQDDQVDAARDAFTRAVAAGSKDAYAHFRLATLLWRPDADRELLTRIETLLSKATALNIRYAAAYDFLADVQGALGTGEPSGLALRAIALEPSNAHHHLTAARALANAHRYDEALKQVDLAAELSESDQSARDAAQLKNWIQQQRK